MSRQESTFRCECGQLCEVTPVDDRQFDVVCPRCRRAYILSWRADEPPPQFEDAPRLPLRSEGA